MELNVIMDAPLTIAVMEAFVQEQASGGYLDLPVETIIESRGFKEFCEEQIIPSLKGNIAVQLTVLGANFKMKLRVKSIEPLNDERLLVTLEVLK